MLNMMIPLKTKALDKREIPVWCFKFSEFSAFKLKKKDNYITLEMEKESFISHQHISKERRNILVNLLNDKNPVAFCN